MDTSGKAVNPPADGRSFGNGTSRRVVLRSAGLVGGILAASTLAGCGSSSQDSSGADGGGGADTTARVATSKVPVGSGVIEDSIQSVVTQPTKGEFKAFNYLCTHQGCPVSQFKGDTIQCACHGSEFSIKDGSVIQGPATKPLQSKKATVKGKNVIIS